MIAYQSGVQLYPLIITNKQCHVRTLYNVRKAKLLASNPKVISAHVIRRKTDYTHVGSLGLIDSAGRNK